jgi:hypothetical protein
MFPPTRDNNRTNRFEAGYIFRIPILYQSGLGRKKNNFPTGFAAGLRIPF